MIVRYVINTLKPGVEPAVYERWLREYDYRVAKTLPSIISYKTFRIEGPIHNAPAGAEWRYIERIEIRDSDQYQKDIASPTGQELIRQLYEHYCDRNQTIFFATAPVDELPPLASSKNTASSTDVSTTIRAQRQRS